MNAWGSILRRTVIGRGQLPVASLPFRQLYVPRTYASRSLFRRGHSTLETQNHYEQKYAEKLRLKAEKEGVKTVTELKEKVLKPAKPIATPASPAVAVAKEAQGAASGKETKPQASTTSKHQNNGLPSHVKTLDSILKLDKILLEEPETIGKIWTEYHANKDSLSAVIPAETYDKLFERAKKYPLFVLPVPRDEGAEMYLLQFSYHQCFFTSLLEYKTHGENARPYLTLTHYTDLKDSKKIVLMHGEISDKPRILSPQDAQFLVYGLQQFYVTGNERKKQLLEKFHHDPQSFSVEELMEELEKLD
ncbi:ATP11-domain-containing protein [Basidiobolus meristosporus CBS 931.73]|uniref:ATP11-domain-containing protein n=1 Tax=Basidiobolus meristosporus CBS 931.73 TaxID=1314790 RepID=A0A1Y1Y7R7_9FUNG|nr:ATP11-domain-containing protein [Basidiobolus meristosporus CBS 931.73]|eukprot:ORX93776.1 ATP11-domain-containing protein [Basidiobolus meristosporus CBS 931.73]